MYCTVRLRPVARAEDDTRMTQVQSVYGYRNDTWSLLFLRHALFSTRASDSSQRSKHRTRPDRRSEASTLAISTDSSNADGFRISAATFQVGRRGLGGWRKRARDGKKARALLSGRQQIACATLKGSMSRPERTAGLVPCGSPRKMALQGCLAVWKQTSSCFACVLASIEASVMATIDSLRISERSQPRGALVLCARRSLLQYCTRTYSTSTVAGSLPSWKTLRRS